METSLFLLVTWQHQPVRRMFKVPEISFAPPAPLDGLKATPWTPLTVIHTFPALLGSCSFSFTAGTPPPATPAQWGCGSLGILHFSPFPSFPVNRLMN